MKEVLELNQSTIYFFPMSQEEIYEQEMISNMSLFFLESRWPWAKNHSLKLVIVPSRPRLFKKSVFHSERLKFSIVSIYDLVKEIRVSTILQVLVRYKPKRLAEKLINLWERNESSVVHFARDLILLMFFYSRLREPKDDLFLVCTQSHILRLPSVFSLRTRALRIMMWYSVNSTRISRQGLLVNESYLTSESKEEIDLHYVWNEEQAQELLSMGARTCEIKGSIVFQSKKLFNGSAERALIGFFDVFPFENTTQRDFYNSRECIQNLNSIVKIVEDLNDEYDSRVELVLKPKRKNSKAHDRFYLDSIRELESTGRIIVEAPDVNLYEFVDSLMGVVCIPFSSPAVIARELFKPVCYFSSFSADWHLPPERFGIATLDSISQLRGWIIQNFISLK